MKKLLFLLLISFAGWSCSTLEDPDTIPASEKLTLSSYKPILKSGGSDTTTIIVRVPKDSGVIPVTFTTTAGTFSYTAAKTDKENTDSLSGNYRYAKTVLKSDTSHGAVYITAGATTVQTRLTLTFK